MLTALGVAAAHLGVALLAGRVALVASARVADGQATLRFAERDADRVSSVLRELGNFDRIYQLREARPQSLREALATVEADAAKDPALQVVFYFSGHADEAGLALGAEHFPFAELRSRVESSRAAVRVALLDTCFSGAVVRTKGGRSAAGYSLDTVEPPRVRGAAIIAAGTANELAQESSAIEGSYFTHHVISALRGAGDRDGNGVVTLAEAYQYAYSHTLAATLPSAWGPQHPSYEYRLSGTGDLAMTQVGVNLPALSFPPGQGRVYVVSTAADDVMAEVSAQAVGRVRLVLPRGRYRIVAREDHRAWGAEVSLGARMGADVSVEQSIFRPIAPELAFAKGHRNAARDELSLDLALSGLGPGTINGTPEIGIGYLRRGPMLSVGPHFTYGSTEGTISGVDYALKRWAMTALLLRRIPLGLTELHVGVAVGIAAIRQRVVKDNLRFGWVPTGAAAVAMDLPLMPWLAVRVLWSGGIDLMRVNGQVTATPELKASLAMVLRR